MSHKSPHIAYIQDVEEYLAVIEDRLQEAVKRAVYANDERAADEISQMQELATDLHTLIRKFVANIQPPHHLPVLPLNHTPVGYLWKDTCENEEDEEKVKERPTRIPGEE